MSKSKATAKQQSLASNVNMSSATMDPRGNQNDFRRVSTVDTIDKAMITQGWEPAALYVFGDKGNLKVRLFKPGILKSLDVNESLLVPILLRTLRLIFLL